MGPARLTQAVGWLAVLAPLPYSLSRVLWAAGIAVGIERGFLDDVGAPGMGSIFLLLLAALSEGVALFVATCVISRPQRWPPWVPGQGGRPIDRRIVVALLLLPLAVLGWRSASHLPLALGGFATPASLEEMQAWSLWAHVAVAWTWTIALAATTFLYARDTRERWPPFIDSTPPVISAPVKRASFGDRVGRELIREPQHSTGRPPDERGRDDAR